MKPNAIAFVSDTNPETLPTAMKACLEADAERRFWILSVNTPNLFPLIQQNLRQYQPEVIAINASIQPGDLARLGELAQMSLVALHRLMDDSEADLPASLQLVRYLAKEKSPTTPMFYFIDLPSPYLTQVILKMGADWVWSPSSYVDRGEKDFSDIADALIESRRKTATAV